MKEVIRHLWLAFRCWLAERVISVGYHISAPPALDEAIQARLSVTQAQIAVLDAMSRHVDEAAEHRRRVSR